MMDMNQNNNVSNDRNYGIDALRIYSMFMIIVLHILSKGGILESAKNVGWRGGILPRLVF